MPALAGLRESQADCRVGRAPVPVLSISLVRFIATGLALRTVTRSFYELGSGFDGSLLKKKSWFAASSPLAHCATRLLELPKPVFPSWPIGLFFKLRFPVG